LKELNHKAIGSWISWKFGRQLLQYRVHQSQEIPPEDGNRSVAIWAHRSQIMGSAVQRLLPEL